MFHFHFWLMSSFFLLSSVFCVKDYHWASSQLLRSRSWSDLVSIVCKICMLTLWVFGCPFSKPLPNVMSGLLPFAKVEWELCYRRFVLITCRLVDSDNARALRRNYHCFLSDEYYRCPVQTLAYSEWDLPFVFFLTCYRGKLSIIQDQFSIALWHRCWSQNHVDGRFSKIRQICSSNKTSVFQIFTLCDFNISSAKLVATCMPISFIHFAHWAFVRNRTAEWGNWRTSFNGIQCADNDWHCRERSSISLDSVIIVWRAYQTKAWKFSDIYWSSLAVKLYVALLLALPSWMSEDSKVSVQVWQPSCTYSATINHKPVCLRQPTCIQRCAAIPLPPLPYLVTILILMFNQRQSLRAKSQNNCCLINLSAERECRNFMRTSYYFSCVIAENWPYTLCANLEIKKFVCLLYHEFILRHKSQSHAHQKIPNKLVVWSERVCKWWLGRAAEFWCLAIGPDFGVDDYVWMYHVATLALM